MIDSSHFFFLSRLCCGTCRKLVPCGPWTCRSVTWRKRALSQLGSSSTLRWHIPCPLPLAATSSAAELRTVKSEYSESLVSGLNMSWSSRLTAWESHRCSSCQRCTGCCLEETTARSCCGMSAAMSGSSRKVQQNLCTGGRPKQLLPAEKMGSSTKWPQMSTLELCKSSALSTERRWTGSRAQRSKAPGECWLLTRPALYQPILCQNLKAPRCLQKSGEQNHFSEPVRSTDSELNREPLWVPGKGKGFAVHSWYSWPRAGSLWLLRSQPLSLAGLAVCCLNLSETGLYI